MPTLLTDENSKTKIHPHLLRPLPPAEFDVPLEDLTRAHFALGQLNGLLQSVPSMQLIATPLFTKEALLSSSIEGTQVTLEDVFVYDAEQSQLQITSEQQDIREIINYRKALAYGVKHVVKDGISAELAVRLQYMLMDSVRGSEKGRGKLRTMQVHIGRPGSSAKDARYVPPAPADVKKLMKNWEAYASSEKVNPLVQAAVAHYQFEAIHPFADGNGRTGRLLIPLGLFARKHLAYPVLYMSGYFDARRSEYYKALTAVTKERAWSEWVGFFCAGITAQAASTQRTVVSLLQLKEELRAKSVRFRSVYSDVVIDALFENPSVSFVSLKKKLPKAGNQTIYNVLQKFVRAGVMRELPGRKRNRVFVCDAVIRALHA